MKYNSPPTKVPEQLQKLQSRELIITDIDKAESFLNRVSYYRFSGYALHFEEFQDRKRTHKFKKGSTFQQIIDLYEFDSQLRKILFTAMEHIEIAFRTQLCLQLALDTDDSHWPLDPFLFQEQKFDHKKFLKECRKESERSSEVFITSYWEKYTEPELPASWMLIEIVPFGTWSRLYSSLQNREIQKGVSKYFGLPPFILQSWIHALTVFRNLCAHHARIWNRSLTIRPKLTRNEI